MRPSSRSAKGPSSPQGNSAPTYVVDAHALYWYISGDSQLSPAAQAVFRLAEVGEARVLVPAIVVAEVYYFTTKRGHPLPPSRLLEVMATSTGFELSPLDRHQLALLEALLDVPEMHDRLIAAEALALQAPVVTNDKALRQVRSIATIW